MNSFLKGFLQTVENQKVLRMKRSAKVVLVLLLSAAVPSDTVELNDVIMLQATEELCFHNQVGNTCPQQVPLLLSGRGCSRLVNDIAGNVLHGESLGRR